MTRKCRGCKRDSEVCRYLVPPPLTEELRQAFLVPFCRPCLTCHHCGKLVGQDDGAPSFDNLPAIHSACMPLLTRKERARIRKLVGERFERIARVMRGEGDN